MENLFKNKTDEELKLCFDSGMGKDWCHTR